MPHEPGPEVLTKKFDSALHFAFKLHRKQRRKGANIPYIAHLLAVTALVIEDGGSEEEAIGALLHDSIEDQGDSFKGGRDALRSKISEKFGRRVAAIVDECTDDEGFVKGSAKTPDEERALWRERKEAYAATIAHKTLGALRVTTADKIHNVESILDAHSAVGTKVWERFRTKSRQDQVDVYKELSQAIHSRYRDFKNGEKSTLVKRLSRAVDLMDKLS